MEGLQLESAVAAKLAEWRVRVEALDGDSALLHHVPTNARYFSKPHTNLLVKRPRGGLPWIAFVDEDLEYTGADRVLTQAFAAGPRQRGWRALGASSALGSELAGAVERALAALGAGGGEPSLRPAADERPAPARGLLAAWGDDLTRRVCEGADEPTVGRQEEAAALVSVLLQWRRQVPVVVGSPGVGKTNLLHEAARRLAARRPEARLVAVDLGALFAGGIFDADRENVLAALLDETAAATGTMLALERLERVVLETPHGPFLLAQALARGTPIAGTVLPALVPRPEPLGLSGRLRFVELAAPSAKQAAAVLAAVRPRLAEHHGIALPEPLLAATVARSLALAGTLPGKAITLLDAAAAQAALAGAREVELVHLYLAAQQLEECKP